MEYLVIVQTPKKKEIAQWWESRYLDLFKAKSFASFEEAKQWMRQAICDEFSEERDLLLNTVFGEEEEESHEEADELFNIFREANLFSLFTRGSGAKKLRKLTTSILSDPAYFPEEKTAFKETDDADHYEAFVCNENIVIISNNGWHMEYNVHRMDREDLYFFFEIYREEEEGKPTVLFSAKLINTEATVNNTETVFTDKVRGKQIKFGKYIQSADDGAKAEPILWDLLCEKDGKMLLLSHKCLDYRIFNDGKKSARWEKSALREWLNGDFFRTAFTEKQRERILPTVTKKTKAKTIEDKVFLLSDEEFMSLIWPDAKKAFPTAYARKRYSEVLGRDYTEPYSFWWLRSPGVDVKGGYDLKHVCANGSINGFARSDSSHPDGIRPAIWIKK